eukprot:739144-Alexandrium_andersonii.AAC.1
MSDQLAQISVALGSLQIGGDTALRRERRAQLEAIEALERHIRRHVDSWSPKKAAPPCDDASLATEQLLCDG